MATYIPHRRTVACRQCLSVFNTWDPRRRECYKCRPKKEVHLRFGPGIGDHFRTPIMDVAKGVLDKLERRFA